MKKGKVVSKILGIALVFVVIWATLGALPNISIGITNASIAYASSSYDVQAAVNYAETWWDGRNPAYYDYVGYDCANFVSQCLIAGGLNLGAYPNTDSYGCIPSCDNLNDYLVNYLGAQHETKARGQLEPLWLLPGDVAIFGDNSDQWRHAVFAVTGDATHYATCNAHSQDVHHVTIQQFFDANPSFTICNYYHVSGEISQPPDPPTPVSPGSGSYPGPTITTLTPWFNWNSVPDADYYGLYIRDLDTDVIVFDSQLDYGPIYGTSFPLPSGILSYGTHYRWNMNSHNSAGWGDYSDRLWFTTYMTPPIVEFFHVSPGSVTLGEEFTITYIVSDSGGFGLKQTELWRANDVGGIPDWDGTENPVQMTALPGYGSYTGGFYDAPPAVGTYWYGLHVVDNAGEWNDERNSRTGGSPGVFGPIQLEVVAQDTVPPTLNAFSVNPGSVIVGNTFTISYTVSDTGGSGLGWIQLWRKYETATWEQVDSTTLSGVGNGPYSGSFYDTPLAVGTYWYGIHVGDDAGNWITEGGSGFSPIEVEVIPVPPATLYVPDDYPTIQAAVNAANPGDTVIVRAGAYTENIDVSKKHLTIQSESGAEATIIQGVNPDDSVFEVTPWADYVTIEGFAVRGATNTSGKGIALSQAAHCNIIGNIVSNTAFGVWLYVSSDNTISQNTAMSNGATGIHLTFSPNNSLIDNVARDNVQGIYLYSSGNNVLTSNTMFDNQRNFFVEAWDLSSFAQNIDTSNKVNGKPIQYLVGRSGLTIDPTWDVGYLGIVDCTHITVQGLSLNNSNGQEILLAFSSFSRIEGTNVSNNPWGIGIDVCGSFSNTIADNTVSNNGYGIRLCLASANTVTGNTAADNGIGIYLWYYCSGNTLAGNTASNNSNGIVLDHSSGNTITSNTASNNFNGIQIYDHSCGNLLTDNTASDNVNGIWLCDYSSNNILTDNRASNNYLGIFSYSSSDNTLTQNTLSNNYQYGILLRYSNNNVIYLNNLTDNANGVYSDDSANTWNSPEEITYTYKGNPHTSYLGNYWSDYTGSDTDEDGIGDGPYLIGSDADNYPLKEPFENYEIGANIPQASFSLSNPSYPDYLWPVIDEEITFDASSSTPSDGASTIVGYLWQFDDGTGPTGTTSPICTHTYSANLIPEGIDERHFTVVLTVMDDLGRTDSTSFDLTVKRPPVLLVHGFQLWPWGFDLDETWRTMTIDLTGKDVLIVEDYDWVYDEGLPFDPDFAMKRVEGNGFVAFISCYTHETSTATMLDIRWYAQSLASEIELIKEHEHVTKVDIVGHSMGGIVSRAYIENEDLLSNPNQVQYRGDVRKLVFLGTPNQGVSLAAWLTWASSLGIDISYYECAQQLAEGSVFMSQLNSGTTGEEKRVEYSGIAGNRFEYGPLLAEPNDTLVAVREVWLDEIPESRRFVFDLTHTQLRMYTGPVISNILNSPSFCGEPIPIPDFYLADLCSPGELRVYDSQGHTAGLVDGQILQEIPNSVYDEGEEDVIIFPVMDSYYCEVVGTEEGPYGLKIAFLEGGQPATFIATDIPTAPGTVHQYTIDWDALSQGEEGVTVQVDSDGDGTFEQTVTSDGELTYDEFVLQTETNIDFDPDVLNLKSKDNYVTTYIELPPGYDVSKINISGIRLNGTVPALTKPTKVGDYDRDRIPDLMVKFDASAVKSLLTPGNQVEITITGEVAGIDFQGSDTIRVIGGDNMAKFPGWLRWLLLWLFGWRS